MHMRAIGADLCLFVGFESQKYSDLCVTCVRDSRHDEVLGIGVDPV